MSKHLANESVELHSNHLAISKKVKASEHLNLLLSVLEKWSDEDSKSSGSGTT